MGDANPPTLEYERKPEPLWSAVNLRRAWPALLVLVVVLAQQGYRSWRDHVERKRREAVQRALDQYVARAMPLLLGDARFRGVTVNSAFGLDTGTIVPSGIVDTDADREALRVIMQGASPPLPLNMQNVLVLRSTASASNQAAATWSDWTGPERARQEREWALEAAAREFDRRVPAMLERDPRFLGIVARRLVDKIEPVGFVDTPADLAALRKLLQDASPPVPIDLQRVRVRERASTTRP